MRAFTSNFRSNQFDITNGKAINNFQKYVKNLQAFSLVLQYILRESLYRSGTVNSKSFVGKVLLQIKWKFELN